MSVRAITAWQLSAGMAMVGLMIGPPVAFGKDTSLREAVVVEAFLEIHTGPGSSYPVFYIAEKGDTIWLMKQRVDWFRIRLRNGTEGWANRREIDKTLMATGYRKRWSERFYDEVLSGKASLGWSAGTFAGDPVMCVRLTYTITPHLAVEGTGGFGSGDFGSTQLYHGGLVLTPWRASYLAVTATMGGGVAHVNPTSLLVNTDSGTFPTAHAGAGVSMPLFRNLEGRVDVRHFTLFMSTERTLEFQEYSAGLTFRF